MAKMRAVEIARAKGPLTFVEREIPVPVNGTVRIKVEACGICHSDSFVRDGAVPGITYPRVPGHEVVGRIDAIGPGVSIADWKVGQRVGVGWFGGNCGHCRNCRRGQLWACATAQVTGLTFDGGYAQYMVVSATALARVPDELSAVEAAPLLCAGVTTFNALRHSGAGPGDLVGVLGIGGLGHLGVQFSSKMGHRTVAIARGMEKQPLAAKLGASHYIDTRAEDPAVRLTELGGASAILATVTSGEAMSVVIGGLDLDGTLLVIGAGGVVQVAPYLLIAARRSVKGCYSGTASDSEDTLDFAVHAGVRSMNEVVPFSRATDGFERMMSGKARFRVVMEM